MPPKIRANQAEFFFRCGDLDASTFSVARFEGTDTISKGYSFDIELISSDNEINPDDVINKQATLYLYRDGNFYPYSGIINEFSYLEETTDYCRYTVTLVSRLWLLSLNTQTRVFQKMSVDKIIEKVFNDVNLSNLITFELQGSYSEKEYTVQYNETDLNFVQRLMESNGIWYFFKEKACSSDELSSISTEEMVISDKPASFENIEGASTIVYRSKSGMTEMEDQETKERITSVTFNKKVIAKEVVVKNYNYRTPEVNISSNKNITGGNVGSVYEFGGGIKDVGGAQKSAELSAARIASGQIRTKIKATCRGLRAAKRFDLAEHSRSDLNGQYLVISIHHEGSHTPLGDSSIYSYDNEFTAIPSGQIQYFHPQCDTPKPKIPGVFSAMIETNGADYASLDDQGRYKVRMAWDISDAKNSEASKYVRLSQPYAGADYGIHFPSHEGAEMLMACVNGDPDKPIGLGTVPNSNTVSPVKSSNKEKGIIRTAGGNEICLDDTADKQKITIKTNAVNAAEFDDENKRISVISTDKNQVLIDDKNSKVEINAKKNVLTLDYDKEKAIVLTTEKGHVVRISDKDKKIIIQSNKGNTIEMDDSGNKITMVDSKKKNTVTLDGSKGIILDSKGEISINAAKDIKLKGANINMNASTGKLEAKATTDMNLSGMKINQKATTDFKIEGLNVESKGQLEHKIEGGLTSTIKGGLSSEISSDLQMKVGGTITELSGSGITTVKGAVVMIN